MTSDPADSVGGPPAGRSDGIEIRLRRGVELHQRGLFGEAESEFRALVAEYPESFIGWMNLALLLASVGNWNEARHPLDRAVTLNPTNADALSLRGACLYSLGLVAEAEQSLRDAIVLDAVNLQGLITLGDLTLSAGRYAEAADLFGRASRILPHNGELLAKCALAKEQLGDLDGAIDAYRRCLGLGNAPLPVRLGYGRALISAERLDEAEGVFNQILRNEPRCADAHFGRGLVFERKNSYDLAEECYSQAVRWDSAHAASWLNKGVLLGRTSRHQEAKHCLEHVTRLVPADPVAFLNLGITQQALGLDQDAAESYREALRLDPRCSDAALNLGAVLQRLEDLDAAEHQYRLAARIRPEWAEPVYNLGVLAHESKYFDVAVGHYDAALGLDPDHVDARLNRALAFLATGDYQRGWLDFEARLKSERCSTSEMSTPPIPRWMGEPLRGKRLMVLCEQGFGDSLQFFRFLRLIHGIGGEVSLVAPPRLNRLFSECRPAGLVRVSDNFIDDWSNCSYYCFLMSLPALLDIRLDDLGSVAVPYLHADESCKRKWRLIVGNGDRRVGVVWRAGNKSTVKGRDVPIDTLEPLLSPRWDLMSLQKDPTELEAHWLQQVGVVRDFSALQDDFTDAAGLIECMDLVITVDTSVAHLAGALGKETWVLLPYMTDWRWMESRDDCPWYPSVRLFRQSSPGEWSAVMQRVKTSLDQRYP